MVSDRHFVPRTTTYEQWPGFVSPLSGHCCEVQVAPLWHDTDLQTPQYHASLHASANTVNCSSTCLLVINQSKTATRAEAEAQKYLDTMLLTLKVLTPQSADCKESGTSYHGRFCGCTQNSDSGYHGSWNQFIGFVASATMVASDNSCLFLVGGVWCPRDCYFAWNQFVRKRRDIPFQTNVVIMRKPHSQLLHALTPWLTVLITRILFHEQLWPLPKLLCFSVSRYLWHEQIICAPHNPISWQCACNYLGFVSATALSEWAVKCNFYLLYS